MSTNDLEKLRAYFSMKPVRKVWVFGSFSRGEEKEDSDIDLLVAFDEGVGLFEYAAMNSDLEKLMQRDVDLVSEGSLFPWVVDSVNEDKILIYERETAR